MKVIPAFTNMASTAISLIDVGDDSVNCCCCCDDTESDVAVTTVTGIAIVESSIVVVVVVVVVDSNMSVFAAIAMDDANVHPITNVDMVCTLFSIQGCTNESTE